MFTVISELALVASTFVLQASHLSDRVDDLRASLNVLTDIDPSSTELSDFAPLVDHIGDARVVSLGEMTHGDGSAFLLRTRLVRFLHEELGFDVIAFESGMTECASVMEALRGNGPIGEAIERGIYDVWSQSAEIRPLFEYIRATLRTDRPLHLVGFDPQFSSPDTPHYIRRTLSEALGTEADVADEIDDLLAEMANPAATIDDAESARWSEQLDVLANAIGQSANAQAAFAQQVIESLKWQLRAENYLSHAPPFDASNIDRSVMAPERVAARNARDRGMAENLLWNLAAQGSQSKIIIWAANNHVKTWSEERAIGDDALRLQPMGEHIKRALGNDLYTVVTTCHDGARASASIRSPDGSIRWQHGVHQAAPDGSLAALLHNTQSTLAWLDLNASAEFCPWLSQPLLLRKEFDGPSPRKIGAYCDAVLFIDSMAPATAAHDQ